MNINIEINTLNLENVFIDQQLIINNIYFNNILNNNYTKTDLNLIEGVFKDRMIEIIAFNIFGNINSTASIINESLMEFNNQLINEINNTLETDENDFDDWYTNIKQRQRRKRGKKYNLFGIKFGFNIYLNGYINAENSSNKLNNFEPYLINGYYNIPLKLYIF